MFEDGGFGSVYSSHTQSYKQAQNVAKRTQEEMEDLKQKEMMKSYCPEALEKEEDTAEELKCGACSRKLLLNL